jgi:hypothetical protein
MNELTVITREEWGAKPAIRVFPKSAALGCVIHHWASMVGGKPYNRDPYPYAKEVEYAKRAQRDMQYAHMHSNGWSDIGQHFTVTKGGIILEARTGSYEAAKQGLVVRGAHAGNNDGNKFWWGIECEGHYLYSSDVPEPQWNSIILLVAHLLDWGNLPSDSIKGHKDFTSTACPGHLYDLIPKMMTDVEKLRKSGEDPRPPAHSDAVAVYVHAALVPDAHGRVEDGRSMAWSRALARALGGAVVDVSRDDLTLQVGGKTATLRMYLRDGRGLVSLRDVADAFGLSVRFNPVAMTVTLD